MTNEQFAGVVIGLVGTYVIVALLVDAVQWWWQRHQHARWWHSPDRRTERMKMLRNEGQW